MLGIFTILTISVTFIEWYCTLIYKQTERSALSWARSSRVAHRPAGGALSQPRRHTVSGTPPPRSCGFLSKDSDSSGMVAIRSSRCVALLCWLSSEEEQRVRGRVLTSSRDLLWDLLWSPCRRILSSWAWGSKRSASVTPAALPS